ncbi:MAG: acyltransferase family protein [Muribaculaceae bacterium]
MEIVKKQRLPNFEILRVMAMLMIVIGHFFWHGMLVTCPTDIYKIVYSASNFSQISQFFFLQILYIVSNMGVNLFVMITGYFMITSRPRWEKVPIVWFQVMFYCVAIYAIVVGTGYFDLSIRGVVAQFLPILSNKYWFVTQYVGLIALSPIINILVNNLSKQQYRVLLIVMLVMDFMVLGNGYGYGYGLFYSGEHTLFHFITMYLLAGYMRIHGINVSAKKSFIAFCLSVIAVFCLIVAYELYLNSHTNQGGDLVVSTILTDNNSFTLFMSFFFFLWISNVRIKQNWFTKALVWMAPYTFGVYLINDSDYLRRLLWNNVMQLADVHSPWLVLYILTVSVAILFVCSGIDFVRKLLFDFLRVNERLTSLTHSVEQYFKNRL